MVKRYDFSSFQVISFKMLPWKPWVPAPASGCCLKNIPQHGKTVGLNHSKLEDWERFGLDYTFKYHQKMADVTIQCLCECLMYGYIYIYIYQVWDDPNQAHAGGWYTNINHHLLGEVSIYVRECARIYPSQKKTGKGIIVAVSKRPMSRRITVFCL